MDRHRCHVSVASTASLARRLCSLLLGVCGAFFANCASQLPPPSADDGQWASQRWPGAGVVALAEGRDLYVRKCSGCHELYSPVAMESARWPALVARMVDNAALSAEQRDLITHFLVTASRPRRVADSGGAVPRMQSAERGARSSR